MGRNRGGRWSSGFCRSPPRPWPAVAGPNGPKRFFHGFTRFSHEWQTLRRHTGLSASGKKSINDPCDPCLAPLLWWPILAHIGSLWPFSARHSPWLFDRQPDNSTRGLDRTGVLGGQTQLDTFKGLVQRIVYYGCRLYSGQLVKGDDWRDLRPVYSICLLDGILWREANPSASCLSPGRREIGAGLGRQDGGSHAGAAEV